VTHLLAGINIFKHLRNAHKLLDVLARQPIKIRNIVLSCYHFLGDLSGYTIKMNFISLFSGCGGFDKGFVDNGFKCLAAYDIDPVAVKVYNRNIGNHAKEWDLSKASLPDTFARDVDIVLAGSPCQGFSTIGKRRIEDPRNSLLLVGGKITVQLGAKYFIAENVMGSVSGALKSYWWDLENYLNEHGYKTRFYKIDIMKIGLPQLRKRIIMIATKGEEVIDLEHPNFAMIPLKKVLANVESLPNHDIEFLREDTVDYKIANRILPGQKLSNVRGGERAVHTWDIPEVYGPVEDEDKALLLEIMSLRRKDRKRSFGDADPVEISKIESLLASDVSRRIDNLINRGYLKKCDYKSVDLVHTFNGKYRRLCYTRASPTVDTRFGNPKYFLHPEQNRAITAREAARIQGFPDDFIFTGNRTQQFRMIGNAVPPLLSNWLAKELKNHLP
jgi:DNA (cytosine-5)-methyltransferase 1